VSFWYKQSTSTENRDLRGNWEANWKRKLEGVKERARC